jgi:DNA repair protein RecN (Recombination protein N)
LLKDLAPFLGDIHGQHDQQRLFARDAQLELLDEFGLLEDAAGHVADLYQRWRQAARDLEELDRAEQERLRLADLWAFQRREIEAVAPHPGEDDALEQEKRVLSNVNRLAESASAAYEALFDAPESCMTSLRAALRKIDDLCRIDPSLGELRESLNPAEVAIEEASRTLRDYLSKLEADPGRLEEIESRLSGLDKLKRKYGRTIEEVLVYLNDLGRQLQDAETAGARREELKAAESKLVREFEAAAQSLSEARRRAAAKLEKRVEQELAQLAMARSVFEVAVTRASAPSASGVDEVAFLLSPNPGEEPKPMERIASGGELSRVALALKTVINEIKKQTSPPTLVFDEVDAGIGGSVAESVGRRLKLIAAQQQVLCVTHSAQIAGFADHHYAVEKREHKGRITTAIEELARDARVRELARMMAGSSVTPEVLKHAEQMISR